MMNQKKLIIIFIFQFFLLFLYLSPQSQVKSEFLVLKNGLRVFVMERHNLPLVNIVIAFNVGSKDEDDKTNGFTHLLEHLILFRNIGNIKNESIGKEMRTHGAYLNGHTSRDIITFEISLPSEFFDFAIKSSKEMVFDLKIDEKGFSKEKEIIIEEINSYYDDPEQFGIEAMHEQLFKGHPYARPTYGKKENIEKATIEEIYNFYNKFFVPSNCAISIVGDINKEYAIKKIKEIYEGLKTHQINRDEKIPLKPLKKTVKSIIKREIEQAYLIFGVIGPEFESPFEIPMRILTEILGSGSNPRLWRELQSRGRIIHNMKINYIPYKYSGVITIIVNLPPKKVKTVERLIKKVLKEASSSRYSKDEYRLSNDYYLAFDELESAKNKVKIDQYHGFETGLNVAFATAKYLILREKLPEQSYLDEIEKVNPGDLRKTAREYLYRDRYSIVIIEPKNEKN